MKKKLETLVREANNGDRQALESVVMTITDLVYNLSLKMLLFPEDAKDASQEILIKIITHLSTFNGGSQFTTWVYRVATNYLLNVKGKKSKEFSMSFDAYSEMIDMGQSVEILHAKNAGELSLLEEEVKVSCTQGLLLCLNESGRMVYILGEILEFNSLDGAEILQISPQNFRKQLSRSRSKIRAFLQKKCGLANPENPCRCTRKIDFLIEQGMINPVNLQFANFSNHSIELVKKIDALEKSAAIYRSVPDFNTPGQIIKKMKETISLF